MVYKINFFFLLYLSTGPVLPFGFYAFKFSSFSVFAGFIPCNLAFFILTNIEMRKNNYWVWGTVCVAFYSTAVLLFGAFMGTTVYDPDAREDSKAIGWTGAAFLLISTVGSHVWKIVFQKPEPGATSVNNLIF